MRRARTDSLQSIAGIWPEREWSGVTVMRPLLQVRRSELRNYLQGLGQPWLEDPSNDDRRFERVRIRQGLAGELGNFGQQANAAQEIVKRAALAVKEWCDINLEIHPTGFLTVRRSAISKLASDELDLVIIRLIEFCGSSIRKVELEERIKLQSWLREAKPARRTLGGALFAKRQDVLICAREPGRISKIPAIIQDGQNLNWDRRFTLNGPAGASVVPLRDIGPIPRCAEIPAFVQAGLPAIVQNGQIWSIPHLGIGNDVFVKFLRH
jgi:tRNA(Ile)-lysidine synthase